MEGILHIENEDLSLTIKRWNTITKKLTKEMIDNVYGLIKTEKVMKTKPKMPSRNNTTGKFRGLFPKDNLIAMVGRNRVYKPIVDVIMKNMTDEFSITDMKNWIDEYYKHNLKRPVLKTSLETFATTYARYLEAEKIIKRNKRTGQCEKIKKSNSEQKADPIVPPINSELEIYLLAKQNRWDATGIVVDLETLKKHLTRLTEDQIKQGLSKLIQKGKAEQRSPNKVRFR